MRLQGKVAVITGGSSGIGLTTARHFRAEGAQLVIFGRSDVSLKRAAAELGRGVAAVRGNVTCAGDLKRLFATATDRFGGVDALVANAGVYYPGPFDQIGPEDFDRTCEVNFKGTFFTVQEALPHLRAGASVILITSTANEAGVPGLSVYSATKAAVRSLARTLSAELLPRGIRVNALSPGVIETPIFSRIGMTREEEAGLREGMEELIPMRRLGSPEEVAKAAVFLASDESSYMAGTELVVSGGLGEV
jgi:NAD(P)-dependent dehydrogenase (short-subunit alcohol dehydrogenase family)